MLFQTLDFFLFFIVFILIYSLLPNKLKAVWLLICSCYFYACWKVEYLKYIFLLILLDYTVGICLERYSDKSKRKFLLFFSIIGNLSFLFIFKYYNFFYSSTSNLLSVYNLKNLLPYLYVLLPIGISFHIFQSMAYTFDVYYKKIPAERNFLIYALYVIYFPQLVAGPIERGGHLIPQLKIVQSPDYNKIAHGVRLVVWGLFKKMVVADRLAAIVDPVYGNPSEYSGFLLLIATIFFSFQIYFDFSAYTDIAIGISRIIGIDLNQNFNCPYFATSIRDFWKRWHITLTSWFRDYVYIPLGGSRGSRSLQVRNVVIVFLLSGIWHGANWTFLIWGALHGTYYVSSLFTRSLRERVVHLARLDRFPQFHKSCQTLVVFTLVTFAWIFFRANNIHEAFYIIHKVFADLSSIPLKDMHRLGSGDNILGLKILGLPKTEYLKCVLLIIMTEAVHSSLLRFDLIAWMDKIPALVRWGFYYGVIIFIVFVGKFLNSPFLYFQF